MLNNAGEPYALEFITFDNKASFKVSPQAIQLLQSFGDERIGVIAVAGKYRTGKSFLLNRILLDQR